jgi:DNA-binding MarR family transcriptional regulator
MDAATTKGVIDRLRRKGLVESRPSDSDRRRLEVSLTLAGAELVRAMLPRARAVSAQTVAGLDAGEIEQLLALLDRIGGGAE